MRKIKQSFKDRPEIWVPLIYVVSVFVLSTLVTVFLILPSNAEESKRECESMGGKIVALGMCQMNDEKE